MKSRRQIIQMMPFAAAALLAACGGPAETTTSPAPGPAAPPPPTPPPAPPPAAAPTVDPAALPLLEEADPTASALGYVTDVARVDTTKFANFVPGSRCDNCTLYSGLAGVADGPCSLFPRNRVAAAGWCSGYAPRPA